MSSFLRTCLIAQHRVMHAPMAAKMAKETAEMTQGCKACWSLLSTADGVTDA